VDVRVCLNFITHQISRRIYDRDRDLERRRFSGVRDLLRDLDFDFRAERLRDFDLGDLGERRERDRDRERRGGGLRERRALRDRDRERDPSLPESQSSRTTNLSSIAFPLISRPSSSSTARSASSFRS